MANSTASQAMETPPNWCVSNMNIFNMTNTGVFTIAVYNMHSYDKAQCVSVLKVGISDRGPRI